MFPCAEPGADRLHLTGEKQNPHPQKPRMGHPKSFQALSPGHPSHPPNAVQRKLVQHPGEWPWSSWGFYVNGESGLVKIDPMD